MCHEIIGQVTGHIVGSTLVGWTGAMMGACTGVCIINGCYPVATIRWALKEVYLWQYCTQGRGGVPWRLNEIFGGSENKLHAVNPGPKISQDMLYQVLDLLWTTNYTCVNRWVDKGDNVLESAEVDVNPSVSQWPKWTIKPKVQADQAVISDNNCANLNCEDPKAPREMIMCAGLGCQSKVSDCESCAVLCCPLAHCPKISH
jgi:hypothetical protein